MARTKIEKIANIKEQIQQLENRRKRLIQEQNEQERKDRTKRLCRRMGLFESLLPDSIPLSEEHFKTFLEKTILSESARNLLSTLTTQTITTLKVLQESESATHGSNIPNEKPTDMARDKLPRGANEDENAE